MAKPKRNKRLPKQVDKLTDDEVMRKVFGKREADRLKTDAHAKDEKPEKP